MAAEVTNLRRARKAKARTAAEHHAATNRAVFGRTLQEKQATAADTARRERELDGAKREG